MEVHLNFSAIQINEIVVLRENIPLFLYSFFFLTYLKKVVGLVYFLVNTSSEKFKTTNVFMEVHLDLTGLTD